MQLAVDDIVTMKKKHPCGGDRWKVTRIGADIKAICLTCGRVIMLDRAAFEKRIKSKEAPRGNEI